MSPEGSYYNSFKVSVKKYADLKKVMSGELTPPEVGVRIFRHPRKFIRPLSSSDPPHAQPSRSAVITPASREVPAISGSGVSNDNVHPPTE